MQTINVFSAKKKYTTEEPKVHVIYTERWEKDTKSKELSSKLLLSYCGVALFVSDSERDTYRKSMRKALCMDCAAQQVIHRKHGFTDDPIPVELLFPGRVIPLATS